MLVKALILGREDGLFHQGRNLLDADHRTALFAELADQDAVGRIDAQGDFRLVFGERLDGGQVGVRQKDDENPLARLYGRRRPDRDRKSTRLNSSHMSISYAVFCLKKK